VHGRQTTLAESLQDTPHGWDALIRARDFSDSAGNREVPLDVNGQQSRSFKIQYRILALHARIANVSQRSLNSWIVARKT
jgi:hypothetical protein